MLINRELLTKGVHSLSGFRRLHVFTTTILILSSNSEGVGSSLHQVFQHHAALLGRGAHRHPLSGCSVFLFHYKVCDASSAIVLWIFP